VPADWCVALGQVQTWHATRTRTEALQKAAAKGGASASSPPKLPESVAKTCEAAWSDASQLLQLGMVFLDKGEAAAPPPGAPAPPKEALVKMRLMMQMVLAYVLRHLCAPGSCLLNFRLHKKRQNMRLQRQGTCVGLVVTAQLCSCLLRHGKHRGLARCATIQFTSQSATRMSRELTARCACCSADSESKRTELWTHVAQAGNADCLVKAFAAYGLANDACARSDAAAWERWLQEAHAAFAATNDVQMLNMIAQHRQAGCSAESLASMASVMDANEIRFGQNTLQSMPKPPPRESNGSSASSSGSGAKLVPGGKGAGAGAANNGVASSGGGSAAKVSVAAQAAARQSESALKELDAQMREGYDMYNRGECAPCAQQLCCMSVVI
jgi:hypothetical protein